DVEAGLADDRRRLGERQEHRLNLGVEAARDRHAPRQVAEPGPVRGHEQDPGARGAAVRRSCVHLLRSYDSISAGAQWLPSSLSASSVRSYVRVTRRRAGQLIPSAQRPRWAVSALMRSSKNARSPCSSSSPRKPSSPAYVRSRSPSTSSSKTSTQIRSSGIV